MSNECGSFKVGMSEHLTEIVDVVKDLGFEFIIVGTLHLHVVHHLGVGVILGVEVSLEEGKGLVIVHALNHGVFVKLFLFKVEPFLVLVGLVVGTDNRGFEIQIPDLVVGKRFCVFIVDLDESISHVIGALVHEIVIRLLEHHLGAGSTRKGLHFSRAHATRADWEIEKW